MDRSQSQLENSRPHTGLRPPSKLPALNGGRTLQETTASDLNSRSMLPPPSIVPPSIKHKASGLPEPQPPAKRRTLADRAADPPTNPPRTTSALGVKSSGYGSRPASASVFSSYRNPSNASTASSVSNGRPPSRQTNGVRQPARPTSAALRQEPEDDQDSEPERGYRNNRKGTPILSFHSPPVNGILLRKTRTHGNLRQTRTAQARSQHSGSSSSDTCDDTDLFGPQSRDTSASSMSSAPAPSQQPTHPGGPDGASQPSRNVSLNTQFAEMTIATKSRDSSSRHRPSLERIKEEVSPSKIPKYSCTPSLRHAQSLQTLQTPSKSKHVFSTSGLRTPASSVRRDGIQMPRFLTKDKLSPVPADDTKRLDDMEQMYKELHAQMQATADKKNANDETLAIYKNRAEELADELKEYKGQHKTLSSDLERTRSDLHTVTTDLKQARRDHDRDIAELVEKHKREKEVLHGKHREELQRIKLERERDAAESKRTLEEAKTTWEKAKDVETADLTSQHWEEMDQVRLEHEKTITRMQKEIDKLQEAGESRATESASEVQLLREQLTSLQGQLDAASATTTSLRSRIVTYEAKITTLEQEKLSLVSKTHFLEGNQEAQSQEFTSMREKMEEAIAAKDATMETLRKEEALRRKLNAMILELRGNIRVFVRTRPLLGGEDDPAKVDYLDEDSLEGCKQMIVHAPATKTATGRTRNDDQKYEFDRVFTPGTENTEVFAECKELIQSVVDGYNVSILSYGQTGSGKTYGMTGPSGIIPSSIRMLLSEMERLQTKGWEYAVEASFVEVYNETLNDLLGDAKTWDEGEDLGGSVRGKRKEKHEIHHDPVTGKTSVTGLTAIGLWPPPSDADWPPAAPVNGKGSQDAPKDASYTEKAVTNLLATAEKNRRVAATKANERSSRSHSIFMLTLKGSCASTNESTEGVLNLVDLAGSERLKQSGAEGSRMKETQAINKSLSSLGDVIAALGNKSANSDAHVPYRNSKLTYLLQSSLGGTTAGKSSRTLMLLHLSPLQAHWQESKSSLMFGSKVHGTHIGSAKKR